MRGGHFFRISEILKKVAVPFLSLLVVLPSIAQLKNNDGLGDFSSKAPEKLYVHTDRDDYKVGNTVWFKVYLVDGVNHVPGGISGVVYVELYNTKDQLVDSLVIHSKQGMGQGNFNLSPNLENGTYRIRAYTQYMRNFGTNYFFEKSIIISNVASLLDRKSGVVNVLEVNKKDTLLVQFYPESESLLNESLNKIAFTIKNKKNEGVTAKGQILDEAGELVLEFNSSTSGLGFFEFVPKKGKKYKAVLIGNASEQTWEFPPALDRGIKMVVVEFEDHYRANIESNVIGNLDGFVFRGRQRQGIVFTSQINGNKQKVIIKVPKSTLREGVAEFRLFDGNGNLKLSRNVFYEGLETLPKIRISTKSKYEAGKPMGLDLFLATNDPEAKANVSISITKETADDSINRPQDIRSYFLMGAEMKLNSSMKNYLSEPSTIARKENLDVFMLTHEWKKSLNGNLNKPVQMPREFKPEKGFSLIGTIKDETNQLVSGAKVSLNYKGSNEIGLEEVKTDSLGRFAFGDLVFKDSTLVSLVVSKPPTKERGKGKKNKDMSPYLSIELDSLTKTFIENRRKSRNGVHFLKPATITDSKNVKSFFVNEDDESRLVVLDEVAISAGKLETENRYRSRRMLYKNPTQTLDFEEVPTLPFSNVLEALVARVPGLTFRGDGIYLRGASSFRIEESVALILVDGTPMENATVVEQIPVSEVDFIDVLKGPKAAIYGARGANGIIAIYTKIGPGLTKKTKKDLPLGSLAFVHPGFDVASEFNGEVPKNGTESYTLYWNPSFFLNTTSTLLELNAPKVPGTYKIRVEGMSFDGRPISKVEYFEVR